MCSNQESEQLRKILAAKHLVSSLSTVYAVVAVRIKRQQLSAAERSVIHLEEKSMGSESALRGSCLCGVVRITAKTKSNSVGACHCSMCRKWGGGPLFAAECENDVHFEGAEYISIFSSSEWAERGFCQKCGTHLFYRLKQERHYAIPVGLFDGGDQWTFAEQIFIDQKPSFYSFAEKTKNLTGAEVFAQYSAD